MAKFRDWVEPAHPSVVKQHEDLVNIYKFLREGAQLEIDKVFDKVSSQIGFVVTTTLPVTIQIGDGGKIGKVELAARNLEGTVFEREFAPIFKRLSGQSIGKGLSLAGNYNLALLWVDALKLKLKHDWIEPAHFRVRPDIFEQLGTKVRPEVQEPAHWFDANIALELEEELLISVIDEVYSELKLADRVAFGRYQSRKFIPGVREPAHFRHIVDDLIATRIDARKLLPGVREPAHFRHVIDELIDARIDVRKVLPGVREPAHFRKITDLLEDPDKLQMLSELSSLLRKLGL